MRIAVAGDARFIEPLAARGAEESGVYLDARKTIAAYHGERFAGALERTSAGNALRREENIEEKPPGRNKKTLNRNSTSIKRKVLFRKITARGSVVQ